MSPRWRFSAAQLALAAGLVLMAALGKGATMGPVVTELDSSSNQQQATPLTIGRDEQPEAAPRVFQVDLINHPEVQRVLVEHGLSSDSSHDQLRDFIPMIFEMHVWPTAMQQELGPQVLDEGLVAFNFFNTAGTWKNSQISASWNIVLDNFGNIRALKSTINPIVQANNGSALHFCAFKTLDPDTFILGGNYGSSEEGPMVKWHWKSNVLEPIGANRTSVNCHDIQRGTDEKETYWVVSTNSAKKDPDNDGFEKIDAETGNVLHHWEGQGVNNDNNHAQLVDGDKTAFVSSRYSSAISKVDVLTGEILWVMGSGSRSNFTLYELNGSISSNGYVFHGQHNAEYFGSNGEKHEIYMLDNAYESSESSFKSNSSRILVIEYDEATWEAHVVFEYPIGVQMEYYGDADRLPTGNILASLWGLGSDARFDSYSQVFEVVRDETAKGSSVGSVAFRVDIGERVDHQFQGANSSGPTGNSNSGPSWEIYSAERFYEKPLIWGATCLADSSELITDGSALASEGASYTLSFLTTDVFKHQNPTRAAYTVTCGHDASLVEARHGGFDFEPHWRRTAMTAQISSACSDGGNLTVTNKWGQQGVVAFACESV